ncbi:thiamine pyrophosphate-binding protein [Selenomonas noxia]|jgi:thiamine pyrophosphate enzyme TPP binding domain protein
MKLSDYVMAFLAQKGIKYVFMLPGGGCMHLVDSLGRSPDLEYVACLHEQAAAIAAESYAQNTNEISAVLVTTGPGGTNTVTGLAAAWIDSTPVIFLSGQVKRSDRIGGSGVRQMGSQEVDIVPVVAPLTKFAVTIMDPAEIRCALEKAYHLAMHGRRGPVWIDIPLDVQAAEIEPSELRGFVPAEEHEDVPASILAEIKERIAAAKRPVLLAGNGVKAAGAEAALHKLREKTGIPTLLTWKTIDMLGFDDPQYFGTPGGMGHRYANFVLQNADLLLVLGSRLDSSLTAWNHRNFAPHAKKIVIDIDPAETDKLDMDIAVRIDGDLAEVLPLLGAQDYVMHGDLPAWQAYCARIKEKYPAVTQEMRAEDDYVDAHVFIDELSRQLTADDIIVPESSGAAGEITYQALRVKRGQRVKNAAGLGSMGFGVPYAMGACLAGGKRRTVLIDGDGAFQLNIQELATIVRQNLPIKMFLWMNGGYASIMGTQRNFFEGRYVAADEASGLAVPDIGALAAAYGFRVFHMDHAKALQSAMAETLAAEGPALCLVRVSPFATASPRTKAVKLPNGSMMSKPLEDMWPFLPAEEIAENMIAGVSSDAL